MSDVLIKGMEMPKNCEECGLSRIRHSSLGDIMDCKHMGTVGSAFKDPYDVLNTRHPECPLIEVNAPYGDLIDGDLLKRKAQKVATEAWKMKLTAKIETTLNQFIDWINDAPIIIKGSSDVK